MRNVRTLDGTKWRRHVGLRDHRSSSLSYLQDPKAASGVQVEGGAQVRKGGRCSPHLENHCWRARTISIDPGQQSEISFLNMSCKCFTYIALSLLLKQRTTRKTSATCRPALRTVSQNVLPTFSVSSKFKTLGSPVT